MSDYISREEAKKAVVKAVGQGYSPFNAIVMIPAADVRPVKRGEWLPKNEIGDCCYQCSDCGFVRDAYILDIGNFCPNCGARMDGES